MRRVEALLSRIRSCIFLPFILTLFLLSACQQELYSGLAESEANDMLAILLSNGIAAEKGASGKEGYAVTVASEDVLRAIALLRDNGLPHSTRDSVGKVFQKSGIMSSPFEERVRYIYALGEDVAQTLSSIDGVVAARVHIVLPDTPQLGQPVKPSSAAVFIKHRPGVDLDFFVPQIKRLVSSAIEGLEYSAVTVVLAEASPTKIQNQEQAGIVEVLPGLAIRGTNVKRFWEIAFVVGGLLIILLGASIWGGLNWFKHHRKTPPKPTDGEGENAIEPS